MSETLGNESTSYLQTDFKAVANEYLELSESIGEESLRSAVSRYGRALSVLAKNLGEEAETTDALNELRLALFEVEGLCENLQ